MPRFAAICPVLTRFALAMHFCRSVFRGNRKDIFCSAVFKLIQNSKPVFAAFVLSYRKTDNVLFAFQGYCQNYIVVSPLAYMLIYRLFFTVSLTRRLRSISPINRRHKNTSWGYYPAGRKNLYLFHCLLDG